MRNIPSFLLGAAMFVLLPCGLLCSETITVTINEAGYGNGCRWEIERDGGKRYYRPIQ